MSKTFHISLFFFLQFAILNAQDIFEADNFDIESMDGKQSYNWVNNFNKSNLSVEKRSQKTHKLDSIYGYRGSAIHNRKLELIFLEDKDIGLSSDYDSNSDQYTPNSAQIHYYENNMLIKYTFNTWDGNYDNIRDDNPQVLNYYTYNENNLIHKVQSLNSATIANGGRGNLRTFEYDINNNLKTFTSSNWNYDTQTYDQTFIRKYDHDDVGNLIEVVNFDYSIDFGWFIEDSTALYYNENNQLIKEDKFNKGLSLDCFKHQRQKNYDYNEFGTIKEYTEHLASFNSPGNWSANYLYVYEYTAEGSLSSLRKFDISNPYLDYYWEEQYERSTYEYDESITADQIQYRRERFTQFGFVARYNENHMLLKERDYKGGNQFESERFDQGLEYFYSKIETSSTSDIVSDHNISVYPNPTSDYITFELPNLSRASDLTITDINGQLVLSQKYTPREKLSVRELKSGVYIYSLVVGGRAYVGRFVVD